MLNRFSIKLVTIVTLIVACSAPAFGQFRDLLGGTMKTKLKRKKPPKVYLMGETINVQVKSQTQHGNSYERQLESLLESSLIGNDRRLQSEAHTPATRITCQITRADSSEKWEQRTVKERKKVGQRWDPKKLKNEDVYETVDVVKRYKVVNAAVYVSFQVRETRTRNTLEADNIFASFNEDYLEGNGAPSTNEMEQRLVRQIVDQITPRIVPTYEEVEVMLPVRDWKNTSRLGQNGLWGRMRDALEKMEPKKKPKDDAYRYFGIGLAYEALAYEAETIQQTMKLLEDATFNYNKAIEMNSEEKYFLSPQKRIDDAIAQYRKLIDQQAEYAKAKGLTTPGGNKVVSEPKAAAPPQSPPAPQPPAGVVPPAAKSAEVMTNHDVIESAKAGLDEANLIEAIRTAPAVQFDLSLQAQREMLANKVTNAVIKSMRDRQSPARRPSTAPRRKPTP